MILTSEQSAAIGAEGKVIVSASAGSGKTFVMIEKLVNLVVGGADLDEILAVTFTKKAAAQIKEKLRAAIIKKIDGAADDSKRRLKAQLQKIASANISTIHSYCKKLIRTYFYALGIDSGFDVISSDDAAAKDLKNKAIDEVFERFYEEDDGDFRLLLSCFMRKRSDLSLRAYIFEAYPSVRKTARYRAMLDDTARLYTDEGFEKVCSEYAQTGYAVYDNLYAAVENFERDFYIENKPEVYGRIFEEMKNSLKIARGLSPFDIKPPLTRTRKPPATDETREADEAFKEFKNCVVRRYNAVFADLSDRETEREKFFESGKTAAAFSKVLLAFDDEYSAVKREENKLDYDDLEHFTLRLLEDENIRKEINAGFKYAYVDEYQDVNPVQEEIISALTGECFLVGDVKQAIYGFRGSKSKFFSEKYESFEKGAGRALRLSSNFRSSDAVLGFVNALFSRIMRPDTCGIDYKNKSQMLGGGLYPEGYGFTGIHILGADEPEPEAELGVYSVKGDRRTVRHTREGLAVLSIVERELQSKHYDLGRKEFVDTRAGDICILTRKNQGASAEGIISALTDAGYAVAGAQDDDIRVYSEVKQMLDILSLIDNSAQDIPLITALLSPLGGFCEDELAQIRIAADGGRTSDRKSFAECCEKYAELPGKISQKLGIFGGQLQKLRQLSDILSAGEIIDALLSDYGIEEGYGTERDRKVKNVLRLAEEGASLPLSEFLEKVKSGGAAIPSPAPAPSDSIKIMSMHASKGLEFPIVIIADICRTFKGRDYSEIPFDEEYGFAPKFFDKANMLVGKTMLRRLAKVRADGEELKNELNLFYVACTRAMCNLHVLAEEVKPFDETRVHEAKCYADLFDISVFNPLPAVIHGEVAKEQIKTVISRPDEKLVEAIGRRFEAKYAFEDSINLPVKSSASAILRLYEDETVYIPHRLFGGEGETNTDKGTAYHRFLELCDFSVKDAEKIRAELARFAEKGEITKEQSALLDADELAEILSMTAFENLKDAELYREQEFLCRLPAVEILETRAKDTVLVQGAIDLLARGDFGVKIIDYKYSSKPDEELIKRYGRQLELYKKAVSVITGVKAETIKTVLVNIFRKRQIELN